jgi:hypothetical protein
MGNVKIVLNAAGIQELLKSAGVQAFIQAKAQAVAAAASAASGGVFEATTQAGRTRARGSVITADKVARKAESEHAVLSKAGHASGGTPGR